MRRISAWLQILGAAPAAVLPLLPSFTCPACVAAYAGALSALGLGFVLTESVLGPLIGVFLVVNVVGVARSTCSHRNPWPLLATVISALIIVCARLVWDAPIAVHLSVGLLVGAAAWNLWIKRPRLSAKTQCARPAAPVEAP